MSIAVIRITVVSHKNGMPKNFTFAKFGHPVSKAWPRPWHALQAVEKWSNEQTGLKRNSVKMLYSFEKIES